MSVVNPALIKGFAKGELLRTKTDKVDAAPIAIRFCAAIKPPAWIPLPPEIKQLQALLRSLESLMEIQQQEKNRLGTSTGAVSGAIPKEIAQSIESHLE